MSSYHLKEFTETFLYLYYLKNIVNTFFINSCISIMCFEKTAVFKNIFDNAVRQPRSGSPFGCGVLSGTTDLNNARQRTARLPCRRESAAHTGTEAQLPDPLQAWLSVNTVLLLCLQTRKKTTWQKMLDLQNEIKQNKPVVKTGKC